MRDALGLRAVCQGWSLHTFLFFCRTARVKRKRPFLPAPSPSTPVADDTDATEEMAHVKRFVKIFSEKCALLSGANVSLAEVPDSWCSHRRGLVATLLEEIIDTMLATLSREK